MRFVRERRENSLPGAGLDFHVNLLKLNSVSDSLKTCNRIYQLARSSQRLESMTTIVPY